MIIFLWRSQQQLLYQVPQRHRGYMLIAIPMNVLRNIFRMIFVLAAVTKPLKVNQKLNNGPTQQNLILIHTFKMKAYFLISPGDLLSRWNDVPHYLCLTSHIHFQVVLKIS